MHWREMWDIYAEKERENYREEELSSLLKKVQKGMYGRYYTIWYVISERASAEQAAEVLFHVLEKKIDYLYRYHAAAALLKLLGISHIKPVDLSGKHGDLEPISNIMKKRDLLK